MSSDDNGVTPSTQEQHPNRASFRTVLVTFVPIVLAFLEYADDIATAAGVEKVGWVAGVLSVVYAINRVLNTSAVTSIIRKYLPWLAPDKQSTS